MDKNIPVWSEYFMQIAETVALRSKDPVTKVGAVIVSPENRIISTGFNGFPPGFLETDQLWTKPTKYKYVVHAEANAILFARSNLKSHKLFITLFPCPECAKLIAGAGIKEIFYKNFRDSFEESKKVLLQCGVSIRQVKDENSTDK